MTKKLPINYSYHYQKMMDIVKGHVETLDRVPDDSGAAFIARREIDAILSVNIPWLKKLYGVA